MKVADYVVKFLADHGISFVPLVYGGALGDLVDAFTRTKNIRYVSFISEQGASFAAEGWAKVTGKPGCAMATSGPGGGNLVTGIMNAYYDSVPMIFITGQVGQDYMTPDPKVIRQVGFQETDIVGIVTPITKYAVMLRDPSKVRYELEKAFYHCAFGRPGPVLLDFPTDVQKAEIDPGELEGFDPMAEHVLPSGSCEILDAQIATLLDDISRAERPVFLIGGGVRLAGAERLCREVISKLGIPAYPTWNAIDVITSDFPWCAGRVGTYGGAGRNFGIQNSDLLIAVGSRISGRITGGVPETFARAAKKYFVDIDEGLLRPEFQPVKADVNIHADARLFFVRLNKAIDNRILPPYPKEWTARCIAWWYKYDPVKAVVPDPYSVHPYLFVRELSEKLPADAVIISDSGGNQVTAMHALETKWGQRQFSNNGNSPIGFSFCAAIGAWFANPNRPVVCIIGDGGFQINIQELQTVKNYGVNIKVFLLNNKVYGITRAYQETNFEGRSEACMAPSYTVPDFVDVIRAYDLDADACTYRVDGDSFIESLLEWPKAAFLEVVSDDFHAYYPKVSGWGTPIEQMEPLLDRAEFEANMIIEPVDGWKCK